MTSKGESPLERRYGGPTDHFKGVDTYQYEDTFLRLFIHQRRGTSL